MLLVSTFCLTSIFFDVSRWLLQGLQGLAAVGTIQTAEVDAAPGRVDDLIDQLAHGPFEGGAVIPPEEMHGHGRDDRRQC